MGFTIDWSKRVTVTPEMPMSPMVSPVVSSDTLPATEQGGTRVGPGVGLAVGPGVGLTVGPG